MMNLNLDDPEMQKPASQLPSVIWDIIVALNIRTSSVEYVREAMNSTWHKGISYGEWASAAKTRLEKFAPPDDDDY
jgi:hypothetical protein